MLHSLRLIAVAAALAAAAPSFAAGKADDPARYVTHQLSVGGAVEHPLTLSVADLRALAPREMHDVPLICQSGANMGQLEHFKGVPLRAILEQAVIASVGHNDVKKMVVIAGASDGYKVVFSWSELFNSELGDGVMVFFERDGLPLADDEGRIAMVSTRDIRTGPRHVKWLRDIEVRKVAE